MADPHGKTTVPDTLLELGEGPGSSPMVAVVDTTSSGLHTAVPSAQEFTQHKMHKIPEAKRTATPLGSKKSPWQSSTSVAQEKTAAQTVQAMAHSSTSSKMALGHMQAAAAGDEAHARTSGDGHQYMGAEQEYHLREAQRSLERQLRSVRSSLEQSQQASTRMSTQAAAGAAADASAAAYGLEPPPPEQDKQYSEGDAQSEDEDSDEDAHGYDHTELLKQMRRSAKREQTRQEHQYRDEQMRLALQHAEAEMAKREMRERMLEAQMQTQQRALEAMEQRLL